jgi:hypothetical protein
MNLATKSHQATLSKETKAKELHEKLKIKSIFQELAMLYARTKLNRIA